MSGGDDDAKLRALYELTNRVTVTGAGSRRVYAEQFGVCDDEDSAPRAPPPAIGPSFTSIWPFVALGALIGALCICNVWIVYANRHNFYQAIWPTHAPTCVQPLLLLRSDETHSRAVLPFDMQLPDASALLVKLEHSMRHVMQQQQQQQYACLCMHHFAIASSGPLYRVCSVYKERSEQLYVMVNPRQVGHSNDTVSCKSGSVCHRTIYAEWLDPATRETHYARFIGRESTCLQQALHEMNKK